MNDLPREPETFRDKLYTIDRAGARRWVYATEGNGRFRRRRTRVAYVLLLIYLAAPWVTINGRQAVLFNLPERKFIIAGIEFWATDSVYLMLVLASLGISLFLFTALTGRVWCGWACPQTIYLEFLFRPIERLIEGKAEQRRRLDALPWNREKLLRKTLKLIAFGACAWLIANTFLAYLYGAKTVLNMIRSSPGENPAAFGLSLSVVALVLFEFGWFREQFCTVLCPYARFQSVMLDERSLVIGYDTRRGEPRGKVQRRSTGTDATATGDCVDCGACVRVCPTGIDIRNGLQLECVSCAACIDACDEIMTKISRPVGLIRYDTERGLEGKPAQGFRPRVIIYAATLCTLLGLLAAGLSMRLPFDADIIRRATSSPFVTEPDGRITNAFFAQLSNKTTELLAFDVRLVDPIPGIEMFLPAAPISVPPGQMRTSPVIVRFPRNVLERGKHRIQLEVSTSLGARVTEVTVLGPD